VFLRQSHALLVLIAHLVIVGRIETSGDTIAATNALKVTREYSIVTRLVIASGRLWNGFVLDLPRAIFIDQCKGSRPCLTIAQREGERSRGG
jgi:hypothetical protein